MPPLGCVQIVLSASSSSAQTSSAIGLPQITNWLRTKRSSRPCPRKTTSSRSRCTSTPAVMNSTSAGIASGSPNGSARAAKAATSISSAASRQPWAKIVFTKTCNVSGCFLASINSAASFFQLALVRVLTKALSRKPAWPSTCGAVARHRPFWTICGLWCSSIREEH